MAGGPPSADLQTVLDQHSLRIRKPRWSVLFRRGEQPLGVFVLLSGKVSLDFGVDFAPACSYGPGALFGLSSTITRRKYSMTATVTEDAECSFLSSERLDSLLHEHPELYRQLLAILAEKKDNNHGLAQGSQQSGRALATHQFEL